MDKKLIEEIKQRFFDEQNTALAGMPCKEIVWEYGVLPLIELTIQRVKSETEAK